MKCLYRQYYSFVTVQLYHQFLYCSMTQFLFHTTVKWWVFFLYNIHYSCIASLDVEMMYVCFILYFVIWSYWYKCECPPRAPDWWINKDTFIIKWFCFFFDRFLVELSINHTPTFHLLLPNIEYTYFNKPSPFYNHSIKCQ